MECIRAEQGDEEQGQRGAGNQPVDGWPYAVQRAVDSSQGLITFVEVSEQQDNKKGRQHTAKCGDKSAGNAGQFVADKRGVINDEWAWRHFGNGQHIGKFHHTQPGFLIDDDILDDGQGGMTTADAEEADFKIGQEDFPIKCHNGCPLFLIK